MTTKIAQVIRGIPRPAGVAFSPDGTRAYITIEDERPQSKYSLYVVDTETGKFVNRAPLSGQRGNLPAITNDGKRLLLCVGPPRGKNRIVMSQGRGLDVVDTAFLKILKVFPMKGHDCYTTPDGKCWLAGFGDNLVAIAIYVQTEQPVWEINFHYFVTSSAIETAPDGSTRRLLTPLGDLLGFAVVDFATHKEVAFVKLPEKPMVKLGPPLTRRNAIPTNGSQVSPDGTILAIGCRGYNGVFLYSLPEVKLLAFVSTPKRERAQFRDADGGDPGWVAFSPDSKTLYVANAAVDSVSGRCTRFPPSGGWWMPSTGTCCTAGSTISIPMP